MINPQGLSKQEVMAWRAFAEMQELLRGRIEQQLQRDSSLSSADYTVLVALSEAAGGSMRVFALAELLQWEKSRLHHQLSRMCARSLVARRHEGRAAHAAITAAGSAALTAARPAHSREIRRLVIDRLDPQQLEQLHDISRRIINGLRDSTDHALSTADDGATAGQLSTP